jgi:hypothetical protein
VDGRGDEADMAKQRPDSGRRQFGEVDWHSSLQVTRWKNMRCKVWQVCSSVRRRVAYRTRRAALSRTLHHSALSISGICTNISIEHHHVASRPSRPPSCLHGTTGIADNYDGAKTCRRRCLLAIPRSCGCGRVLRTRCGTASTRSHTCGKS